MMTKASSWHECCRGHHVAVADFGGGINDALFDTMHPVDEAFQHLLA